VRAIAVLSLACSSQHGLVIVHSPTGSACGATRAVSNASRWQGLDYRRLDLHSRAASWSRPICVVPRALAAQYSTIRSASPRSPEVLLRPGTMPYSSCAPARSGAVSRELRDRDRVSLVEEPPAGAPSRWTLPQITIHAVRWRKPSMKGKGIHTPVAGTTDGRRGNCTVAPSRVADLDASSRHIVGESYEALLLGARPI